MVEGNLFRALVYWAKMSGIPMWCRFRDERICWNTGGYDPDCDRFIRSCLEIVMSVSSGVQLLPKNALSLAWQEVSHQNSNPWEVSLLSVFLRLKSALVPRADHIARGLSWPMEPCLPWLGHLQHL